MRNLRENPSGTEYSCGTVKIIRMWAGDQKPQSTVTVFGGQRAVFRLEEVGSGKTKALRGRVLFVGGTSRRTRIWFGEDKPIASWRELAKVPA